MRTTYFGGGYLLNLILAPHIMDHYERTCFFLWVLVRFVWDVSIYIFFHDLFISRGYITTASLTTITLMKTTFLHFLNVSCDIRFSYSLYDNAGDNGEITTTHLLLGIWSEKDSAGHKILASLGFDDDKANELVKSVSFKPIFFLEN